MARNGSGTYVLPAGQPVVTGTTISSTTHNTLASDLANALTTSIASDGQTTPTANLKMGGFKLTGLGAATVAGDAIRYEQVGTLAAAAGANSDITSLAILPGYLFGCTLSTAGSSATMSIAAGRAQDSTGAFLMQLSAIAKTTAAWAVGTAVGGLDTGAIANSTWYHFHVIRRPDTGVVDVIFSLSADAPTLPANYTQYRRIGSGKTNGSAQWTSFTQSGDVFQWVTPVADVSAVNPGTAAVSRTLSVPLGISVIANVQLIAQNIATAGNVFAYLSDLSTTDQTPSLSFTDTSNAQSGAGGVSYSGGRVSVRTNTSQQIRSRISFSDANSAIVINTFGWTDDRGRNA